MINRIFFISERVYRLPAKAGIYGAIPVTARLEEAYKALSAEPSPYALLWDGAEPLAPETEMAPLAPETEMAPLAPETEMTPLAPETARMIEAFSFIPGCMGLVRAGTRFDRPEALLRHYGELLRGEKPFGNDLFFAGPEAAIPALVEDLERMEETFALEAPVLYGTIGRLRALEAEQDRTRALNQGLTTELDSQRQFVEVLRSGHGAKEIQEYYNREYEILPLWYKRAGHLLKVLTGKRTWRSLFRDDVKKHTD